MFSARVWVLKFCPVPRSWSSSCPGPATFLSTHRPRPYRPASRVAAAWILRSAAKASYASLGRRAEHVVSNRTARVRTKNLIARGAVYSILRFVANFRGRPSLPSCTLDIASGRRMETQSHCNGMTYGTKNRPFRAFISVIYCFIGRRVGI